MRDSAIWDAATVGVGEDGVAAVNVEDELGKVVVVKKAAPKGGLRKHRMKEPSTSSTGLDADAW